MTSVLLWNNGKKIQVEFKKTGEPRIIYLNMQDSRRTVKA